MNNSSFIEKQLEKIDRDDANNKIKRKELKKKALEVMNKRKQKYLDFVDEKTFTGVYKLLGKKLEFVVVDENDIESKEVKVVTKKTLAILVTRVVADAVENIQFRYEDFE